MKKAIVLIGIGFALVVFRFVYIEMRANEAADRDDVYRSLSPVGMSFIAGGDFLMGDSEGGGYVQDVKLDSFYMGCYEVTVEEYCEYLQSALDGGLIRVDDNMVCAADAEDLGELYFVVHRSNRMARLEYIDYEGGQFSVASKHGRDMSDDPVVGVTWYGAVAYCNWRSGVEGYEACYDLADWSCDFGRNGYRLPSSAEWEYAARGGLEGCSYPWGDSIESCQANYEDSGDPYEYEDMRLDTIPWTVPVGFYDGQLHEKGDYGWPGSQESYQTVSNMNGYGLYDMAGNAQEWCYDWNDMVIRSNSGLFGVESVVNPTGPDSGHERILRGGSWGGGFGGNIGSVNYCPVFAVTCRQPNRRGYSNGFRLCMAAGGVE